MGQELECIKTELIPSSTTTKHVSSGATTHNQIFTIASPAASVHPSAHNLSRSTRPRNTDIQSSRTLAGGGSTIAPSGHLLTDFEEFELVDYIGIEERREEEQQLSQSEKKRAEKRKRLDEADEMKFSHSIQFNAVPDWSSHYIAYSNLKKLYAPHSLGLKFNL